MTSAKIKVSSTA